MNLFVTRNPDSIATMVCSLPDQSGTWNFYLYGVRENYRRLPALQDEIVKAGLQKSGLAAVTPFYLQKRE